MKIIIDIPRHAYVSAAKKHCLPGCDERTLREFYYEMISKGVPLDDIKDEIEEIEINGHIRDVECFSAGVNAALKIIDKYGAESEK